MNRQEIEKIIPHRHPFLFLDEVEIYEPAKRGKGILKLTGEEEFFKGHFPGNPVMPGVLMVEAMAQVFAVILLSDDKYIGKTAYFGSIEKAKFRKIVKPGDCLEMHVEITRMLGAAGKGKAYALVDGVEVCTVEATYFIGD